ncbi:MAG: radical SAM protein [Eubacteriales bacterium]|nr:radical SAM protein [Eubacteriales bacterium]
MGPLDDINKIEKRVADEADRRHEPIGGTFELLPLCNMNCKMCYVRMTPEEMQSVGRLRTLEEWTEIGRQAVEAGLLFLLITGGEPLLYPDFLEFYQRLHGMGLVISINSNGTLMTEEIAEVLGIHKPRRVNMTIYGASDETYGRICGNPKGFTQLMHAVELLRRYKVPFKMNFSATPYNIDDLEEIYRITQELDVKLDVAPYMFPPMRKLDKLVDNSVRLSPEEAAKVHLNHCLRTEGVEDFLGRMNACYQYHMGVQAAAETGQPVNFSTSIPCRAGSST